ncbi:hypothetical protein [Streptomyces fulvoviolaceus]|uniref:hypothetical protein n=1 Tax=Streptomyces fulvoviolaceus TaxID=285535 RepID=UPI0004C9B31C|nr:hypothetical protein [Streptomyces fulvoviolaceus]
MTSVTQRLRDLLHLSGRGLWFVSVEALLALLVARSLWTWRDDAYVAVADVPYLPWLSAGLTASVVLTLAMLSRRHPWLRRLGWCLTVARLCVLPLLDLEWNPGMSPYISLW